LALGTIYLVTALVWDVGFMTQCTEHIIFAVLGWKLLEASFLAMWATEMRETKDIGASLNRGGGLDFTDVAGLEPRFQTTAIASSTGLQY
jgi:hypothetical protein